MIVNKGDLISREALKKSFAEYGEKAKFLQDFCQKLIDNAPTVIWCSETPEGLPLMDLRERPQGRWIQTEIIDDDSEYGVNDDASECSNCKHIESSHYWTTTYYHYCPNCGARMKGGAE